MYICFEYLQLPLMNVIKLSLKIKKFHNKCIFRILFFTHEKHKHFPKFFPCSSGHCAKGARLCLYVRARFVPLKRKSNFTSVDYQSLFYCTERIFSFTKEKKTRVLFWRVFLSKNCVFPSNQRAKTKFFEIGRHRIWNNGECSVYDCYFYGVYRILILRIETRNFQINSKDFAKYMLQMFRIFSFEFCSLVCKSFWV